VRGSGAFVLLMWCSLGAFFLWAGSRVFVSAGEPADSDAMIFGAVCAGAIYLFWSFVIAVIYSATLPRRPASKPKPHAPTEPSATWQASSMVSDRKD
jgi:hypothetical protein